MADPVLQECLDLVGRGVPFDVAFSLDANTRAAWCIFYGEREGNTFDWSTMQWAKTS